MSSPVSAHGQHVVLVEDDESIGSMMVDALTGHGYRVDWRRTGASAMAFLDETKPDLVVLDAGLPDADGFSICRWLRKKYTELPIVLCTARDAEIDVIVGLDSGATDYITKPFSVNVLMARTRAHLRVHGYVDPLGAVAYGRVVVDPAARTVTVDDGLVDLRAREFDLLLVFVRNAGRVVTREKLLAQVWDVHWQSTSKTLEMHVLALRRKLGDSIEIATIRGIGYRLVNP